MDLIVNENLKENQRFEISEFAQQMCDLALCLNPETDISQLKRRLQFLIFDAQHCISSDESIHQRVHQLSQFIFNEKNFRIVGESLNENFSVSTHMLDNCITKKSGTLDIVCGLYYILCESLGIHMEFLNLNPPCYLKFCDDGQVFFVDLSQGGRELTPEDMTQIINKYYSDSKEDQKNLMEGMSSLEFVDQYVYQIQSRLKANSRLGEWCELQSFRLSNNPNNLKLISERALVHYELGDLKGALADLKRYFSFRDPQKAPSKLVLLYEHLQFEINQLN